MTSALDELPEIGTPATRALNSARYKSLRQLASVARSDLAQLHGVGPQALAILEAELERHDLRSPEGSPSGTRVKALHPRRRPNT